VKLAAGDIQVEDRSKRIARHARRVLQPRRQGRATTARCTRSRSATSRSPATSASPAASRTCDRARLAESVGAAFREGWTPPAFSNVLGSSLTRRMVQEYNNVTQYDGYADRRHAGAARDFRTQERVRFGGYGDLPTSPGRGAYPALASPTDEKATYAPAKRGGTEDVTLEMIKNDDVGAIRRIPIKMGRAAKRTLAKFVFDFFAPTRRSTTRSRSSTRRTATSARPPSRRRSTAWCASRWRSRPSSGLGRSPGHLPGAHPVPLDLQETVWNAFQRNTNLDKTFVQQLNPTLVPVWYWTDTNDWAALATRTTCRPSSSASSTARRSRSSSCRTCRTWARCSRTTSSPTRSATSTAAPCVDYRGAYKEVV
jgi:hypothetical protein